jgi:hypothetical protein
MTVRLGKRESPKKIADKLRKIAAKSKKIDWNKYFGRIEFHGDAVALQRKMRDEWAK